MRAAQGPGFKSLSPLRGWGGGSFSSCGQGRRSLRSHYCLKKNKASANGGVLQEQGPRGDIPGAETKRPLLTHLPRFHQDPPLRTGQVLSRPSPLQACFPIPTLGWPVVTEGEPLLKMCSLCLKTNLYYFLKNFILTREDAERHRDLWRCRDGARQLAASGRRVQQGHGLSPRPTSSLDNTSVAIVSQRPAKLRGQRAPRARRLLDGAPPAAPPPGANRLPCVLTGLRESAR